MKGKKREGGKRIREKYERRVVGSEERMQGGWQEERKEGKETKG